MEGEAGEAGASDYVIDRGQFNAYKTAAVRPRHEIASTRHI